MSEQQPDDQSNQPYPPRKPPQMGVLFVVFWVLALLALVVLGGCTVMLIGFGAADPSGLDFKVFAGLFVMLAALYGFGRSLQQGRRAERSQQPPGKVFLYTLGIPVITGFIWAGGCLLALR